MELKNLSGIDFEQKRDDEKFVKQLRHPEIEPTDFNQKILTDFYGDLIDRCENVLEIGCGWGRNARFFIENTKAKYFGFDTSDTSLLYFEKNNYPKDRYYISKNIDDIILNNKYDLIFSTFVLQHIGFTTDSSVYDSIKITKILLPTLKNGGCFVSYELHQGQMGWNPDVWFDQCFKNYTNKTYYPNQFLSGSHSSGLHNLYMVKK